MSNVINIVPFLQHRAHLQAVPDKQAVTSEQVDGTQDIPFVYSDFMEIGDEMGIEIEFLIEGGYIPDHLLPHMGNVLSALAVARAKVTAHVNEVLSPGAS